MALRYCTALIFLLIATRAPSQSFEAAYERKGNNIRESYYFWNDGHFSWSQKVNNTNTFGQGYYSIKNDSIILDFGPKRLVLNYDGRTIYPSPSSASTVKISAIRSTGAPLRAMKVVLVNTNVEGKTDGSGNTEITISNPPEHDFIYFEVNGSRTDYQPVQLKDYHNFFAITLDETYQYKENVKVKFKFKRSSRKIVLDGTTKFKQLKKQKYFDPNHAE